MVFPINADGESGIQAKDVSCALSVAQKEMEAFFEQQRQRNVPYGISGNRDIKYALPSHKVNQIDGVRSNYPPHNTMQRGEEDFAPSTEFQGENQPVFTQVNVRDEGNCVYLMK